MQMETERLILRELTWEDFDALYEILSDPETMRHYPRPFDEEKVKGWIHWNLENYARYGFGLWAVIHKETGAFLGDCGITMQRSMASSFRKSDITSIKTIGAGVTLRKLPRPASGLLSHRSSSRRYTPT